MKKVLVLGAGLVSKPLIEYLSENNTLLTVASKEFNDREYLENNKFGDWNRIWCGLKLSSFQLPPGLNYLSVKS